MSRIGRKVITVPAGIKIEEGTVATARLLELSATARPPAGAGAESVKFRDRAVLAGMVTAAGWNASVPPTVTC